VRKCWHGECCRCMMFVMVQKGQDETLHSPQRSEVGPETDSFHVRVTTRRFLVHRRRDESHAPAISSKSDEDVVRGDINRDFQCFHPQPSHNISSSWWLSQVLLNLSWSTDAKTPSQDGRRSQTGT
jgi:hypothetical protein